jgi:glc operon protein GlcG
MAGDAAPARRRAENLGLSALLALIPRHASKPEKDFFMRQKPSLTSADYNKMMAACLAEAEKNSWKVSIAIVDEGGYLLNLARMDGAPLVSAEVATGKAKTSALTRQPSKVFEDRVKDRPAFLKFPAGLAIQGAVPALHDGQVVGAIGVSGVQSHEDEQIAKAGVATLG